MCYNFHRDLFWIQWIYIKFTSAIIIRSGTGTTIIDHQQKGSGRTSIPGRPGGCAAPGCHKAEFKYVPEMVQIEALIELSAECQQTIRNNCTHASLSKSSWWIDRTGKKREYWHGDNTSRQRGCQCGFSEEGCTPTIHGIQVINNTLM